MSLRLPSHLAECAMFKLRGAKIVVPWFDRPCSYYDAILPIRVLLLKLSKPKIYRLITLLMDHRDKVDEATTRHRQRVVDFIRITCRLRDDFGEQEVHHVLGILSVSTFDHDHSFYYYYYQLRRDETRIDFITSRFFTLSKILM